MVGIQNLFVRYAYQLMNPLRLVYWFIFRPKTRGVKCIVECNSKVLFVKLSYAHRSWTIPGGKVGRKESYQEAAYRELFEETGIKPDSLIKIGEYDGNKEFKHDHVEVFYGKATNSNFTVDGFEIVKACWAEPRNPPIPYARRVPDIVKMFLNFKNGK